MLSTCMYRSSVLLVYVLNFEWQAISCVVEELILIDRVLFVAEDESVRAVVLPLFDPDISPRNRCLIVLQNKHC